MSTIDHKTTFGWAVVSALIVISLSTLTLAVSYGELKGAVKAQGEDIALIKDALLTKSLVKH